MSECPYSVQLAHQLMRVVRLKHWEGVERLRVILLTLDVDTLTETVLELAWRLGECEDHSASQSGSGSSSSAENSLAS